MDGAKPHDGRYGPRKRVLTPPKPKIREEVTVEEIEPDIFNVSNREKNLVVFNQPGTSLWGIKYEQGGVVPLPLQGRYTSQGFAIQAINRYIQGLNSASS